MRLLLLMAAAPCGNSNSCGSSPPAQPPTHPPAHPPTYPPAHSCIAASSIACIAQPAPLIPCCSRPIPTHTPDAKSSYPAACHRRQAAQQGGQGLLLQSDPVLPQVPHILPLAGQQAQQGVATLAQPRGAANAVHVPAQGLKWKWGGVGPCGILLERAVPLRAVRGVRRPGAVWAEGPKMGKMWQEDPRAGCPGSGWYCGRRQQCHTGMLTHSAASPGGSNWRMVVTAGKSRPRAATSVQRRTPAAHFVKRRKASVRSACGGQRRQQRQREASGRLMQQTCWRWAGLPGA